MFVCLLIVVLCCCFCCLRVDLSQGLHSRTSGFFFVVGVVFVRVFFLGGGCGGGGVGGGDKYHCP